jgi:anti-sigma-K factor RskA
MPPTPVDEHTEEFEQLAGLAALEVLEGDELSLFEGHAAGCERCRLMVRLDREALARVALSAPEMDPSPDFRARLLQRAADEIAAARPLETGTAQQLTPQAEQAGQLREPVELRPRALPPNVVPLWRRSPWISALAAVLVVALVTAGAFSYQNQPVATYTLSGSATGSATVIIRRSGAAELSMRGVPDPGPGFVYEAWVIPPDQQPVAAGTTTRGDATVPLPGDIRGATVAITREAGRVDKPTSAPVLAAVVQS